MSKKMKRVGVDSSSYGGFDDAKARMKHQGLFQDFQELQRETNAIRDKLEDAKRRKLALLAEVRFLSKRRKYLLQVNSMNNQQEHKLSHSPNIEIHSKTKSKKANKKDASLHRLPPLPGPKPKGRVLSGKETTSRQDPVPPPKHKRQKVHSGKEAALCGSSSVPDVDLNQSERFFGGAAPLFDLNESGHGGREVALPPARAPAFDLNEISAEEEPHWNFEPTVQAELERSTMKGPNEDQHNDLRISLCRNAGEGSSRVRKPKISWQDPVALRV